MTGKEIIEMIKEYNAENFEIIFRIEDKKKGQNLKDFTIDEVPLDIKYSDEILIITGDEKK